MLTLGAGDRVRRRPGGGAPAQPPSRALRFDSHLAFVQLLYHADLSSLRAGLRSRAALRRDTSREQQGLARATFCDARYGSKV